MTAEATTTLADHHEAHPNRDMTYVKVALVLAAITALETLTYFESVIDFGRLLMPILIVCMCTKFWLIAEFFMHLRWDKPVLRRVFLMGMIIALVVYVITLTAFKFWNGTDFMPQ